MSLFLNGRREKPCDGFFCGFFFSVKGCEAERCLWQMQRGEARAKQRETKQSAGFDYVLPLGKSGGKRET